MHIRLSFVLLLLCVGCGRDGAFEDIDTNTPIVSDIPDGKPLEYPKLYVENGLPEYTGAIVTSLGEQVESLKDGLRITAVSNDSIGEIMPFFVESMEKLGYSYDKTKHERAMSIADPPIGVVAFTKEKFRFNLTLVKFQQEQTQIKIIFLED